MMAHNGNWQPEALGAMVTGPLGSEVAPATLTFNSQEPAVGNGAERVQCSAEGVADSGTQPGGGPTDDGVRMKCTYHEESNDPLATISDSKGKKNCKLITAFMAINEQYSHY